MTEAELLKAVYRLAQDRHLLLFHSRDSRGSLGPGFPDLVISGSRGTVFAELKTNGSSVTPNQRQWGRMLQRDAQRWFVWRPRDLQSGTIQSTLDSISGYDQLSM